jgi:glycosyltransferase involved in cell wall biosynthesis
MQLEVQLNAQALLSVLVPAYNEEWTIAPLVEGLRRVLDAHGVPAEIIVIDDGSTDATAANARRGGAVVLSHEANRGYGAALKTGIARSAGSALLIIDGDGTYRPEDIPALLDRAGNADMVVGSRSGREASLPGLRKLAKGFLRALAGYFTGVRVPDLNSGLRLLDKETVMSFAHLLPQGFSFTSTITLAMLSGRRRVVYVPISYMPRRVGSKFHPLRETKNAVRQILLTMARLRPGKVIVTASLAIMVLSAAVAALWILEAKTWPVFPILLMITGIVMGIVGLLIDRKTTRVLESDPAE